MKIDKKILKELRNNTGISLNYCVEALKESKNNYIIAKEILLKKKIKIVNKEKYKILYIYIYNNLCILIKFIISSILIINNLDLLNIIKKIIFLLMIKKYKNIFYLKKNKNIINIKKIINTFILKTKENFYIKKFNILKSLYKKIIYNYNNKINLIILYKKYNKFLTKNICIHIIILKPIFISLKSIKIELILIKNKLIKKKNTSNNLLNKLLNKLLKKYTLYNQYYIKNNKYKIINILKKKKIIINKYIFYK